MVSNYLFKFQQMKSKYLDGLNQLKTSKQKKIDGPENVEMALQVYNEDLMRSSNVIKTLESDRKQEGAGMGKITNNSKGEYIVLLIPIWATYPEE